MHRSRSSLKGLGDCSGRGPSPRESTTRLGPLSCYALCMNEILTIPFSSRDERNLREWKRAVANLSSLDNGKKDKKPYSLINRHVVNLPAIEASTEKNQEAVEKALKEGDKLPRGSHVKLPKEVIEGAKAAFIASGGNLSEVASLYDLTPEAVLRLASQEEWPVYSGSTKVTESKSKGQLTILRDKLWRRLETMLDAMDVEKKAKNDIVQYRAYSEYVEPLASRSSAFKTLMDQYMRVSTLLEPELFVDDPDSSNFHARTARGQDYPGGIEGVNREMADFLSEVVVGIADKINERELKGYGQIIDARAQK